MTLPIPDDRDNPYAPPKAQFGRLDFQPGAPVIPFTVGDVLAHSWEVFRERMGFCLGVFWASIAIPAAVAIPLMFLAIGGGNARDLNPLYIVAIYVVAMPMFLWLNLGVTVVSLKLARRQPAQFGDLFTGAPYILPTIGVWLLVGLGVMAFVTGLSLAAVLVSYVLRDNLPASMIAFVLIFLIGAITYIILVTRLVPILYVIVDGNPGAFAALAKTFRITAGREGMIVLILLVSSVIYFLSFLIPVVGFILVLPFFTLTFAVMYVAMDGRPVGKQPISYSDPDLGEFA